MEIKSVPIGSVKPNENNPRIIKDDKYKKLVTSIKEFPQMLKIRPIVVDENMMVLGGNMRLKACKEAGLKEVPIIKADELTEDQKREFIVKDNVGFGEWDWDALANDWDADLLCDWGLDVPYFGVAEDDDEGNFDDEGISDVGTFAINIACDGESHQVEAYERLTSLGYKCKLVCV
jgi:ParB-like chromosome segregation protein Spo0J